MPTANTALLVLVVQSLSFSLYDKHYGHCVFLYYRENFLLACGGAGTSPWLLPLNNDNRPQIFKAGQSVPPPLFIPPRRLQLTRNHVVDKVQKRIFANFWFWFQYSSLLLVIFVVETSMLICGYLYRDDLTASFHAGLGNGLQMYGKDSAQTAAVDDIQSTVRHSSTSCAAATRRTRGPQALRDGGRTGQDASQERSQLLGET